MLEPSGIYFILKDKCQGQETLTYPDMNFFGVGLGLPTQTVDTYKKIFRLRNTPEGKMSMLEIGTKAPDFKLTATDGKSDSLKEKLSTDLTLIAFFKINCPTCQFTFPFLEKLHKNYAGKGFTLWGISQNNQAETLQFAREYKISFPLLLDQNNYQISYAYGITVVPTLFLIDTNQEILFSGEGFAKEDLEKLSRDIAERVGTTVVDIFAGESYLPAFKAG